MRANPGGRDAVVAGFWLVLGFVLWQVGGTRLWQPLAIVDAPDWVFLALLLGMAVAVTQRSRYPLWALAAGSTFAAVDLLCGGSLGVLLALSDLIFAAVKYSSERALTITLRLVLGLGTLVLVLIFLAQPQDPMVLIMTFQLFLLVAVSGIWGWNVRSEGERTRIVLGEQHASETAGLRDRIAHDLHDLVANQIAVAGLHVEAARLQAAGLGNHKSPDTAALETSLVRAKSGTDEAHLQLRRLITVLTTAPQIEQVEPVELPAVLTQLEALLPVGRAVQWGQGARDLMLKSLAQAPTSQQAIVVRVCEELVMNAVKHGGRDVHIEAYFQPDRSDGSTGTLTLSIANEHTHPLNRGHTGTGLGLRGAKSLVSSIGGDLATERTLLGGEDSDEMRSWWWIARLSISLPNGLRGARSTPRENGRSLLKRDLYSEDVRERGADD